MSDDRNNIVSSGFELSSTFLAPKNLTYWKNIM
jgi:hypothetical protein